MRRAVLAVAVLVLTACGGGGGRLSASEYRSKADAICAEANQKLKGLGTPRTPADLRALLKKARPTFKNAIDDLESLNPPTSLESKVDEWNAKNERLLDLYDDLSDETSLIQIAKKGRQLANLNDEANQFARTQLGLTECATG